MLRKIAKLFAWLFGIAIALAVLFYILVLAINWHDVAPSEEAVHFAQMYANRPQVAAQQNAFIYMVGISVELGKEPLQAGIAMIERARNASTESGIPEYFHPDYPNLQFNDVRNKDMQEFIDSCKSFNNKCLLHLDRKSLTADLKGTPDEILLNRYREMIAFSMWQDIYPRGLSGPIPPFVPVIDSQVLSMFDIWLQIEERGANKSIAMLANDAKFWRMVLGSSESLITSMVATSALMRNQRWTNIITRRLHVNNITAEIPASWLQPITAEERLMTRAWGGEWIMAEPVMRQLPEQVEKEQAVSGKGRSPSVRVVTRLMLQFYQPQESINRHAQNFDSLIYEYNVPYEGIQQVVNKRESDPVYETVMTFPGVLYNPFGKIVYSFASPDFDKYMLKVADLEGGRRALLATLQLRRDHIPRDKVAEALSTSPYLNPYTNEPFEWDEATSSVVFEGLGSSEDKSKRYSFVY